MGLPTCEYADAGHRHGAHCRHDRRKTPPRLCRGRRGRVAGRLTAAIAAFFLSVQQIPADTLRIATFNAELSRKGPGLLLKDILGRKDPQILAVAKVVALSRPDILALQNIDYDYGLAAVSALRDAIARQGHEFPFVFALRPNTGMATGLDMNGNGRTGDPGDAQGFGHFSGQGGMAILSRFPIERDRAQDLSAVLWRDLPGALLPQIDGRPFPSDRAQQVQRLSSTGHWVVPVKVSAQVSLNVLAFHATPPVFDGPEDRNGRRNHDEIRLWQLFLDGQFGPAPQTGFVLLGDANLDSGRNKGRPDALIDLLSDPRLQDPRPRGRAFTSGSGQLGRVGLATVDWPKPEPGNMRVDYVLPSSDLQVLDAGVVWPLPGEIGAEITQRASRHRLVWVDIDLP